MPITSDTAFHECYQDIRDSFPPVMDVLNPLNLALVTQLPFPNGVVPECALSAFFKASNDRRVEIGNACVNGPAIDSLIILLRLFLALGIDETKSKEPKLFDLAHHDFGHNMIDDYIVKGRLLDMLYPAEMAEHERVDVILDELIRHPLVREALWSYPDIQFYKRESFTRKSGNRHFEPSRLNSEFVSRDLPFQIDTSHPIDLGERLSRRLGIKSPEGGGNVAVAGMMPSIIPVIVKGGRPFQDIRSFVLEGPVDYRFRNGAITPVKRSFTYHLRAVANLAESDIRIYRQDTTPVIEQLFLGNKPREYYLAKLKRGEHAKGWTFEEGALCNFLLIYAKYCPGPDGAPYRPPSNSYGEYIPVLNGRGMSRWRYRYPPQNSVCTDTCAFRRAATFPQPVYSGSKPGCTTHRDLLLKDLVEKSRKMAEQLILRGT
jgi:hypothetical protein